MKSPITWIKDVIWHWQFDRLPVKLLGNLVVKEFKGSLYVVATTDEITIKGREYKRLTGCE